jgi:amino acid permease
MKKSFFLILGVFVVMFISWGCSNSGMFLAVNNTNVELSKPNYEILAKGVKGEAEAGYIFGFSYSIGAHANSVAIARVNGTGMLYKEAVEDLWDNFEKDYGSIESRKVAMVNVHYDSELLNLFFYTGVKVFIRADIVEFQE